MDNLPIYLLVGLFALLYVTNVSFREWLNEKIAAANSNANSPSTLINNSRATFLSALHDFVQNDNSAEASRKFTDASQRYLTNIGKFGWPLKKQEAYHELLQLVSTYPNIVLLHRMVVELGRFAYAAERTNKIPTTYDEAAIANDLKSAVGAFTVTTENHSRTAPERHASSNLLTNIPDRLDALSALKASGHISDAEYEQKRQDIINSL